MIPAAGSVSVILQHVLILEQFIGLVILFERFNEDLLYAYITSLNRSLFLFCPFINSLESLCILLILCCLWNSLNLNKLNALAMSSHLQ